MKSPTPGTWFVSLLLRFVWGMLVWAVFLLLSPLLLIATLVFGTHFMSPDEIAFTKVLLVVVGPFAFVFWWIIIFHISCRYRAKRLIGIRSQTSGDYSEAQLRFLEQMGKPRHFLTFVVLLASLAGSICCARVFYNAGDQQFFLGVLAGIVSPVIMVAAWKLLLWSMRSESA